MYEAGALRASFTLLELLIAMAIIAILAALILGAAMAARTTARNAQVAVDIQNLSKSIAQFKQRFGMDPPSRITFTENPGATPWDNYSMGLIRRMWPQFDFTLQRDINGDGDQTDVFTITGAECLVFFLGGIPTAKTGGGGAPTGFSQNPSDPFSATGSSREKFHEFDTSRLVIVDKTTNKTMNSYVDTLPGQTMPYLYISSYDGQGYDVADDLIGSPISGGTVAAPTAAAYPPGGTFVDIYRTDSVSFWSGTAPSKASWPSGGASVNTSPPSQPYNPNSFQIISPGGDQQYGVGGQFSPNRPDLLTGARQVERDNITNFNTGILAP